MNWISVKDRLPDKNKAVLIHYKTRLKNNAQSVALLFDGAEWRQLIGGNKFIDSEVTHWMPLPEPPKQAEVK